MSKAKSKALGKKIPVTKHPDDEGHMYFGKTKKRGVVHIRAGAHDYPRGYEPMSQKK